MTHQHQNQNTTALNAFIRHINNINDAFDPVLFIINRWQFIKRTILLFHTILYKTFYCAFIVFYILYVLRVHLDDEQLTQVASKILKTIAQHECTRRT